MAQRAHVPRFGNWDIGENVPYTAYFEKARKDRNGGKIINPNDPQENPDMFPNIEPLARDDNLGRRGAGESANQRNRGRSSTFGQPFRQSAGSEHSIEQSPLHPHHQPKITGKGSGSASLEGSNSFDSSHGAPGRSRIKPTNLGHQAGGRGAAVPKFGEWDENNPTSAEGYTHIFNQVREERNGGGGQVLGVGNRPSYTDMHKQNAIDDTKVCCFPWARK
ncbi:hypothetical protein NMG60_11014249 [Bertholletia excelsa]